MEKRGYIGWNTATEFYGTYMWMYRYLYPKRDKVLRSLPTSSPYIVWQWWSMAISLVFQLQHFAYFSPSFSVLQCIRHCRQQLPVRVCVCACVCVCVHVCMHACVCAYYMRTLILCMIYCTCTCVHVFVRGWQYSTNSTEYTYTQVCTCISIQQLGFLTL